MKMHLGLRLGAASCALLAAMAATPALATGTTAGSQITNNVSVAFKVGGTSQTAATASNTITVDRKVNVLVSTVDTAAVSVSPNQTNAVTTFTVTNLSNAPLDFALAVTQQNGGAGKFSGNTDNFDVTTPKIYLETGTTAGFSADDTLITSLDEIPADNAGTGTRTVYVVSTIPSTQVTNDVATVILTATAREAGSAGTLGAAITATAGANNNNAAGTYDTVLSDGAGATDSANQGDYSAKDDYKVLAANVAATKTSRVMYDGVNSYPNAKAIPGAIIEYCITVANSGAATATNVGVTDTLPSTTVPYTDATYKGDVGATNCTVRTTGRVDPTVSGQTVSGTLPDLTTTSTTATLIFYAQIQ